MARTKNITPLALLQSADEEDKRFDAARGKEAAALRAHDEAQATALDATVKSVAYANAAGILADAGIE